MNGVRGTRLSATRNREARSFHSVSTGLAQKAGKLETVAPEMPAMLVVAPDLEIFLPAFRSPDHDDRHSPMSLISTMNGLKA